MFYKKLVLSVVFILFTSLPAQSNALKDAPVITVNVGEVVKPVQVKFGVGVGSLHRGPGWPPVDFSDPALIDLINEISPAFINLQYTMSPTSVEHIIGLPFYPEGTGAFWQRLSYIEILEKMGVDGNSTGAEGDLYALFTSSDTLPGGPTVIDGVTYSTYRELLSRPPHKNYDDMLQFFERLDEPPEIFIRVPTIFMTYIDDPFPHSGAGRAEITVDLDAQTGADLVHYLNDPPSTELGGLRAANGRPEPYNVKYFMLGNELWSPHITFGLSIDRVIAQTLAFAKAMKAADSTISLVFNPVNDAFPESFLRMNDPIYAGYIRKLRNFNTEVIPAVKDHIDAVEFFQYGIAIGDGTVLPPLDREGWKTSMALPYILEKYDNAARHKSIAERFGAGAPMIMGEFSGPPARLGGAVFDADYMIYLLNNDYDVFIANWNLGLIETNYYGLISQDASNNRPPIKRPSFYVQKMFNNYFGDTIVACAVSGSPVFDVQSFDTGEYLIFPAEQNVPALNAIATTKDDALYLMVVNRDPDNDIQTQIVLDDFAPTSARAVTLNGPSPDATNEENPENVKIVESAIDNVSASFAYTFEKHSVTVMIFNGAPTAIGQGANQTPNRFRLMQNFPNPFNPTTTIRYAIPRREHVSLTVHDLMGREVAVLIDRRQTPGWHEVQWNGGNRLGLPASSGIYIVRFQAGDFVETKKILFVK